MLNAEFIPNQEVVRVDLCATCSNADTCDYGVHEHKAVWECELFMAEKEPNQVSAIFE